ncbi:hypothetical protein DFH08DRAFT_837992 [Mycena albidolilacea]|uniref:Proteophosphoglycan ppg4 n=1 Tax=Mycena albidolilacea TaxID=1033008 RepID=A0AAD7ANA4_9AGAR|nr:hypothetical protein DFH08DRAFT_837992 [Mycena albidolilacea]
MPLEDEDPLAAALSHAFVSSPSLRPDPESTPLDAASTSAPSTSTEESSVSSDSVDSASQSEYESQVESWRAQSAEARQKAEKERARWEAIRAAEKQEAALRNAALPTDSGAGGETDQGWETVGAGGKTQQVPRPSSPSPADCRDLVAGEPQKHVASVEAPKSQSAQDTGDESQKWEELSDPLTSSFPSLSFPDRTNTPSPHPPPPPPAPLESATLAIFDPSLSTRTRVTALFSSLAINLLLPFVNGVMLGFGEIFAKNIVLEYFGWRPLSRPGAVAASTGLRPTLQPSERTKTPSNSTSK